MKKRFVTTLVLTAILGLIANNAFAITYNFLDTWIDWGGSGVSGYDSVFHNTDDQIGSPVVISMDVTITGGYLEGVDINLGVPIDSTLPTRQLYDSLFINTSYDGTNWDEWNYFVRDGYAGNTHPYNIVAGTTAAPDGFYEVDEPDSYIYTITEDSGAETRDNNPNGIDLGSLSILDDQYATNPNHLYAVSFDVNTNIISYTFSPGLLQLDDGFFIAYSPWCANDVMGGGAPVPEPATVLLFGTGLIGLLGFARKRNKK